MSFEQVSFNSKVDEGLRIQQLSGGQKSLVALATGKRSIQLVITLGQRLQLRPISVRHPEV